MFDDEYLKHYPLEKLREELACGGSRWSDDDLVRYVEEHLTSHNAQGCAFGRFEAISVVCAYRPHLAESVLDFGIEPIYALGCERPIDVLYFLYHHFDRKAWYGGLTWRKYFPDESVGEEGKRWLKEELPNLPELIAAAFERVHIRVQEEIAGIGPSRYDE
jgi:hypothetical protein